MGFNSVVQPVRYKPALPSLTRPNMGGAYLTGAEYNPYPSLRLVDNRPQEELTAESALNSIYLWHITNPSEILQQGFKVGGRSVEFVLRIGRGDAGRRAGSPDTPCCASKRAWLEAEATT